MRAMALVAAICFSWPVQAHACGSTAPRSKAGAHAKGSKSPDRVGFAIQFTGVSKLDKATLRVTMLRRAASIRARAKRMPATDAQDFWVQAKVAKGPDEDGNIGFDLRLVGRFQGRSLRWPELGRRCTFCTDGEFVEMFAEAFKALMERPMPGADRDRTSEKSAAALKQGADSESAQKASLRSKSSKSLGLSGKHAWPENLARDARRKRRASLRSTRLRWWGWMGLGLSAAGGASIVASLATMPRNVPLPENPAQMYPMRPDTATKIGLAVGGTCLVAGIGLWVSDLVTRGREGSAQARRSLPTVWRF